MTQTSAIANTCRKFIFGASMVAATAGLTISPTVALAQAPQAAAQANKQLAVPVTGTMNNNAFTGTFNIQRFERTATGINAVGTLVGSANGQDVAIANVAIPLVLPGGGAATQAAASCQILTLTLGPLHLDLLGLVIDLNQINLNIAAQPGAGNLLGNLLCDIANLLNGGGLAGLLNQLVADLNAIIARL